MPISFRRSPKHKRQYRGPNAYKRRNSKRLANALKTSKVKK